VIAGLLPTVADLVHVQFFAMALLGIVAVLAFVWFVSEHVLDWAIARVLALRNRQTGQVIDFEERRRQSLQRAMGGK
jgi:hypothetical protein